jgi:kinesin family member C1
VVNGWQQGIGGKRFAAKLITNLSQHLPRTNPRCSHRSLGKEVIPFALSALTGFKVCLIAYGQTGSGKTKTMKDVTDLLVTRIFKESDGKVVVTAGYVEVYNGEVRDLLRKPGEGAEKLPIRGGGGASGGGEVDNINVLIRNPEELGDIIRRGNEIRSTFSTSLNERSSRSHSILRLETTVTDQWTGEVTSGR